MLISLRNAAIDPQLWMLIENADRECCYLSLLVDADRDYADIERQVHQQFESACVRT